MLQDAIPQPATPILAGGGYAASVQEKGFHFFVRVEGIGDTDLPGTPIDTWSADGDIACRVDQCWTFHLQPFHGLVRRPTLCHASEIESHACWQGDRAERLITQNFDGAVVGFKGVVKSQLILAQAQLLQRLLRGIVSLAVPAPPACVGTRSFRFLAEDRPA